MGKSTNFEIIAGSYEEFLLGFYFSSKKHKLTQSFAAHDHAASVRCVTTAGHYVASGGADDRICIYDMKARKEHCNLTHHSATITCLEFTENHSHLVSGSSDGVLAIVRVGNWQLEKVWDKAHKGMAVLDVAVHSSGKLALSLGADGCLCTWNLIKGRQAYIINLMTKSKDAKSLEKIVWAPDGVRFILYGGKHTEIWSIDSGGALNQIEHEEKVTSCVWMDDQRVLVGHEDGQLSAMSSSTGHKESVKAHESRVKSLAVFKNWIVSTSSNGEIKVWNQDLEEVMKHDTGCRLTCLCIVPFITVKEEKEESGENVIAVDISPSKPKRPHVIIEDDDVLQIVVKKKKKGDKKRKSVK